MTPLLVLVNLKEFVFGRLREPTNEISQSFQNEFLTECIDRV